MYVIYASNVNDALHSGINLVKALSVKISPRDMDTLEVPMPVSTVYAKPYERVLMYPERDANPFFHFFEGLWMLSGREDVAFLSRFNSNIANYSDDGKIFHAPYGYRLRHRFGIDQFKTVIDMLKKDSRTRRAVMQIWNTKDDLDVDSKDIPCNDLIFLKIREQHLNMTVCCRSNDILWGCYGANAVHFSMIQEYLVGMIGCHIGHYTQISDSFHAYVGPMWEKLKNIKIHQPYSCAADGVKHFPIVTNPRSFDNELERFMYESMGGQVPILFTDDDIYLNEFFPGVAIPMWKTYALYKDGNILQALKEIDKCLASDWKKACIEWLMRRKAYVTNGG